MERRCPHLQYPEKCDALARTNRNNGRMTRLPDPPPVHIAYLNRLDIEALALTDAEILAARARSMISDSRIVF